MKFHKCLLCNCQIPEEEVYCSSCGWDVWAIRGNAENFGGECQKQWEKLKERIDKARAKK